MSVYLLVEGKGNFFYYLEEKKEERRHIPLEPGLAIIAKSGTSFHYSIEIENGMKEIDFIVFHKR